MRDLVETVIGQVLKKDASFVAQKEGGTHPKQSFQSDFMKHVNEKKGAVFVENHEVKNKELWAASLKFEGMLFQQMMQAMRKTIPDGGLLKHGFAQGVQDTMFDQAVSDAASQRGSLGLAMNIYRQMERDAGSGQHNKGVNEHLIQATQKISDSERAVSLPTLKEGIGEN